MDFKAEDIDLKVFDNEPYLCFKLTQKSKFSCESLMQNIKMFVKRNPIVEIVIKKHSNKRSIDANAYLWILCDKIAKKVGISKEEVYRKHITDVGVFTTVPIKNEAVTRYIERWGQHGVGWIATPIGNSKLNGYTNVITYFGSSTYDTNEMALLIDSIVQEAKDMDIETMTPDEIADLKSLWRCEK